MDVWRNASCVMALLLSFTLPVAAAEPAGPLVRGTDPPIAKWIRQLDSDQFIKRELATEQLLALGDAAIKPLAAELVDANREMLLRGTYILRELALSENLRISSSAQAGLKNVAESGNRQARRQANATLERLSEIRHDRSLAQLKRLGAEVGVQDVQIGRAFVTDQFTVELDDRWQGKPEDLRHLQWLRDVRCVKFSGDKIDDGHVQQLRNLQDLSIVILKRARISDQAVRHLSEQKNMQHIAIMYCPVSDKSLEHLKVHQKATLLKLFGTGITAAGAAQLQKEMAATDVDYRAGAFLGIGCDPTGIDCSITIVQPDSAASKADLRVGDVILKYNGKAATDFDSLTKLIGENRPGDSAKVEIRRDGETLVKDVELGEWE